MRAWFLSALLVALAAPAAAEVIQMPEGGRPVPLGKDRVACGSAPEGWAFESDRRAVRPPTGDGNFIRVVDVKVAAHPDRCGDAKEAVTLQATGRWPDLDAAGVAFFPDEGRVELRGQRLAGVQVTWEAGKRVGQDRCVDPAPAGRQQQCTLPVERGLPADTLLRWLPAGARAADAVNYDAGGRPVDPATFVLRPARTVMNQLLPPSGAVDVSQGTGRIALVHPGAVAAVDCGLARCELADGAVVVRGVPAAATEVSVLLRLAPRFYLQRADKVDTTLRATLPVLHCPVTVVSGAPLRDADDPQILLKLDARCSRNVRLRWLVGAEPAEVARTVQRDDGDYVLLRAGRLAGGTVTVTALRADSEGAVIGSVTTKTVPAPRAQATVELPGRGRIDFIPTNRDAVLSVGGAGERAKLVPLPVDGVYSVRTDGTRVLVRGAESVGGFVSLRFGFRSEGLPADFAGTNLAVLNEPVQRPLREASVPAPFWITPDRAQPLADFVCSDAHGRPITLEPGKPARVAYEARESCRVTIHQERLKPEDGLQEVVLDMDVTKADGSPRAEASVHERMVLRPGGEPRVFYVKGATGQFDHIVVRLSHVVDETRYVLSPTSKQAPPSAQWSATIEGGYARLYVTLAIPAGLYRMNEPVGQFTLNFGVLGRITWLDRNGKEGLLGLETGLMGVGLIPQRQGSVGDPPRMLAAVMGLGLRVDIGGGAAVGIHLWGAYEFRRDYQYVPEGSTLKVGDPGLPNAPHWALIFGPSISIGNVGTNL